MPRRRLPPRLYFDPGREEWVVRDGPRFIRTGCGKRSSAKAEKVLAGYIDGKHRPVASDDPLIADVLSVYGSDVAPHKKTARNIGYHITNLLPWWGDKTVPEISTKTCRAYAATKTPAAAGADLKVLKAAVVHWHKETHQLKVMPSFWRPADGPPRDRWLTRAEAARLLRAARHHQHLRRSILLGLYTGSRPGVILALRWDQLDLDAEILYRTPSGKTADKRKRTPPVRLGRRILAHLRRWKRLDGPEVRYVCHYDGRAVEDPHTTWKRAVKAAGLEGITRHTLRHTRATWMMQRGVDIWAAAGFLGMTTKTLERVYGHHDPRHQEQAANI
jgi:integrase